MPQNNPAPTAPAQDEEHVYVIDRSQAFGPNRRYIQNELLLAIQSLRDAWPAAKTKRSRKGIAEAANRLKALQARFDS